MAIILKNPSSPATKKQLYALQQLTGKDTSALQITQQEASDLIQELELKKSAAELPTVDELAEDTAAVFQEPDITIIEGAQRSGKSALAVKMVLEDYYKDAVRIFCETILEIKCEVLKYYLAKRSAKIKYQGKNIFIRIPEEYELRSPIKIFSNIHILGVPMVYIPTFRHALAWLKKGFIKVGWLVLDEAQKGIGARNSQTSMGKDFLPEFFQFAKSSLKVIIITHMAKLIDWTARLVPTRRIFCTYNKRNKKITYETMEKGVEGKLTQSFYAPDVWGKYYTKEKVVA